VVQASKPIRLEFELAYIFAPEGADGGNAGTLSKLITVEAGSDFTKILNGPLLCKTDFARPTAATGIAVLQTNWPGRNKHSPAPYPLSNATASSVTPAATNGRTWLADWQKNKGKNGWTGVAAVLPSARELKNVEGHWLLVSNASDSKPRTSAAAAPAYYYIGAGWSKGWHPTKESWLKTVENFAKSVETPLEISFEQKNRF
jgi:hypothetical protein